MTSHGYHLIHRLSGDLTDELAHEVMQPQSLLVIISFKISHLACSDPRCRCGSKTIDVRRLHSPVGERSSARASRLISGSGAILSINITYYLTVKGMDPPGPLEVTHQAEDLVQSRRVGSDTL